MTGLTSSCHRSKQLVVVTVQGGAKKPPQVFLLEFLNIRGPEISSPNYKQWSRCLGHVWRASGSLLSSDFSLSFPRRRYSGTLVCLSKCDGKRASMYVWSSPRFEIFDRHHFFFLFPFNEFLCVPAARVRFANTPEYLPFGNHSDGHPM